METMALAHHRSSRETTYLDLLINESGSLRHELNLLTAEAVEICGWRKPTEHDEKLEMRKKSYSSASWVSACFYFPLDDLPSTFTFVR